LTSHGARQVLNLVAIVAVIAFNSLANVLPLNGQTTGSVSDRFPVYFVPAGYVFAIWGLIYVGLVAYGVYQALPRQRHNPRLRGIDYLFLVSCVANIVWLFFWHFNLFLLTLPAMLTLLVALILIYWRLGIARAGASTAERWLVHVPFSTYLGWVSVATIANFADVLYFVRWDAGGLDPILWTVIMLAVATLLGVMMALTRRDVAYLLVLTWAFAGIAVKQSATLLVALPAGLAALLVLLLAIYSLRRQLAPGRTGARA
jgi:translocator protein